MCVRERERERVGGGESIVTNAYIYYTAISERDWLQFNNITKYLPRQEG